MTLLLMNSIRLLFLRLGLESDHAYSILDARQVNSQRLVRLRNPWGEKEWKGSLSENWTKWPKSLKQKLSASSANDGVFWMRMYSVISIRFLLRFSFH